MIEIEKLTIEQFVLRTLELDPSCAGHIARARPCDVLELKAGFTYSVPANYAKAILISHLSGAKSGIGHVEAHHIRSNPITEAEEKRVYGEPDQLREILLAMRDAQRYRYLRNSAQRSDDVISTMGCGSPDQLDAAIDAELAK